MVTNRPTVSQDLVLPMVASPKVGTAMGSRDPTAVRVEVVMVVVVAARGAVAMVEANPKEVVLMDNKDPMVDRAAVDMAAGKDKLGAVVVVVVAVAAAAAAVAVDMGDGVKVPIGRSFGTDATSVCGSKVY